MSLVLNVEILGEFKKLTAATQGAQKQLTGLQGATAKISSSIGRAFAGIGAGLSFVVLTRELKEAAKAAVEDAKSQGLLAKALQNTTGANTRQIASVERSISKLSMQAAVADDQLRPAFAQLARATGDVEKSTKLMSLALDVSAGTGRSLDTVVKALSRAVGPDGTTGALERLAPAIKGASDPLAELEKLFKGSAEAAAQLDPYQRLNVALGEVSESVGRSLQPALDSLADWFIEVQPDIESFLSKLTNAMKDPEVTTSIRNMQRALGNLGFTIGTLFGSTETDEAKGFTNFWIVLSGIVETLATLFTGLLAPIAAVLGNTKPMESFLDNVLRSVVGIVNAVTGFQPTTSAPAPTGGRSNGPRGPGASGSNVVININKGNVTAKEIANAVNKGNKTTGAPSIRNGAIRAQ
jgi:hypothetical protein